MRFSPVLIRHLVAIVVTSIISSYITLLALSWLIGTIERGYSASLLLQGIPILHGIFGLILMMSFLILKSNLEPIPHASWLYGVSSMILLCCVYVRFHELAYMYDATRLPDINDMTVFEYWRVVTIETRMMNPRRLSAGSTILGAGGYFLRGLEFFFALSWGLVVVSAPHQRKETR